MSNKDVPVYCFGDDHPKPKTNPSLKWMLLVMFVVALATLVLFVPEISFPS